MIDGFQSRHGSSDAAVILSPLSAEESVEINAAQREKKLMWILQVYCHISAQTRQGRDEVCFKCGYLNLNFFSLSAESNVYSTYKDVLSSEYGDSWLYKTGKAIISVIRVCVHVFYAQLPCVLAFPCLCTCGQKTIQQELKENR